MLPEGVLSIAIRADIWQPQKTKEKRNWSNIDVSMLSSTEWTYIYQNSGIQLCRGHFAGMQKAKMCRFSSSSSSSSHFLFPRDFSGTVYGNSKGFEVKVGMHQGSGLGPLLFVTVMEAISRELRVALSWELLYADDLAVIAETEEDLIKRLNEWKDNVESARWPCGVCSKGVGSNSLQCTSCQKWVHKKCSGIKGSMPKVAVIHLQWLFEPGN